MSGGGASSGFSLPAALTEVSAGVARLCTAPDPGKEQLLQQVKETGAALVRAAAHGALDLASEEAGQLQGLANALQSSEEGWAGQLGEEDVEELWAVCCKLWVRLHEQPREVLGAVGSGVLTPSSPAPGRELGL